MKIKEYIKEAKTGISEYFNNKRNEINQIEKNIKLKEKKISDTIINVIGKKYYVSKNDNFFAKEIEEKNDSFLITISGNIMIMDSDSNEDEWKKAMPGYNLPMQMNNAKKIISDAVKKVGISLISIDNDQGMSKEVKFLYKM